MTLALLLSQNFQKKKCGKGALSVLQGLSGVGVCTFQLKFWILCMHGLDHASVNR